MTGHCQRGLLLIAAGSNFVKIDYMVMDFSFSDMLNVVMMNDHSGF